MNNPLLLILKDIIKSGNLRLIAGICLFAFIFHLISGQSLDIPESEPQQTEFNELIWVGAYLASWEHYAPPSGNWGRLPTDEIDWDAFTHLYYFAINVNEDGSLPQILPYENFGPDRIRSIVKAAHNSGTYVLFSVGGWGNYNEFKSAIKPQNRDRFIRNLILTMTTWNFDGIDVDMEPIHDDDIENYKIFISELHAKLQEHNTPLSSRPILAAATSWQPEMFSDLQNYFDQINLMTYDLSGAWEGWVTWHNSAVYSGGKTFPGTNRPLPSVDRMVGDFLAAGVNPRKLGIGIDFYGYVWQGGHGTETGGVTAPNQKWEVPPGVRDNVPYYRIMKDYFSEEYFRWDDKAKAAYLSIDQPGSREDLFVSFEEEKAIEEKILYAHENQLGGVFIWELTGGYEQRNSAGSRDLLLRAVKENVQNAENLFKVHETR